MSSVIINAEKKFAMWALDASEGAIGLVRPDGVTMPLGTPVKIVRASAIAVACASGVSTPQGLNAIGILDTHSLADTINGTITVPSDCTHLTAGIAINPVWGSTAGTYREAIFEVELFPGVWVSVAGNQIPNWASGPHPGPIIELHGASSYVGKKIRFALKQDSGASITPTSFAVYAQFFNFA